MCPFKELRKKYYDKKKSATFENVKKNVSSAKCTNMELHGDIIHKMKMKQNTYKSFYSSGKPQDKFQKLEN